MSPTAALREPRTRVMSAAALVRPGEMRVVSVPVPEPGPGEVLVEVEACGVCASNLSPWEGKPWFKYPMQPGDLGHEAWGRVAVIGSQVRGLAPGQRVATLSTRAYAEYTVCGADQVLPLPGELDGWPLPGEPLGCAFNVFRRSDIQAGHTVAIVGIGFLGAVLTRLASAAGARVIAISRRSFALDIARRMGATETIPLDTHAEIIARVKDLTGGTLCDRVIEAVGYQAPLDLAGELTRERGRLMIAGYHQDGPRHINMQLWNWRGLDVINAHERDPEVYRDGIRAAVEAIARGTLDPSPLYTHRFPLDRLGEALEMTRRRPDGFMKALIVMEGGVSAERL